MYAYMYGFVYTFVQESVFDQGLNGAYLRRYPIPIYNRAMGKSRFIYLFIFYIFIIINF